MRRAFSRAQSRALGPPHSPWGRAFLCAYCARCGDRIFFFSNRAGCCLTSLLVPLLSAAWLVCFGVRNSWVRLPIKPPHLERL